MNKNRTGSTNYKRYMVFALYAGKQYLYKRYMFVVYICVYKMFFISKRTKNTG